MIKGPVPPGKKPYKFKPGTKALREIKKYQKSTDLLLPRASFARLVRDELYKYGDFRIESLALMAVQESCENYLVHLFEASQLCAIHARRVTLHPADLLLAKKLMDP